MSVCGMSLCGLMCVSVCVLTFQTLYILLETLVVTFHVDVMLHHSEIRRLPNSRLCHEREGVGGGGGGGRDCPNLRICYVVV